jgi:hypothetical protein
MPVELQASSFMAARGHNYPKFAQHFRDGFDVPMPQYMVSPMRPVGAYSKHPREAFQAIQDAADHIRALSEFALVKNAAGVALSVEEAQALMIVHLPPVRQPRIRSGAGLVPDWDVPFTPRDRVPDEIAAREAQWLAEVKRQRKQAIGDEIAMIESIRAQMLAQTRGPGR